MQANEEGKMRCGLIGEKLSHSYSALIHQKLGAEHYELISLSPQELDPFLRKRDFDGINVTIPYKKAVIPYCDDLDEISQRIGSVNTIVKDDHGRLHGYNTDYYGFLTMCRRAGINFSGKKVLILGTGGTSLTAAAIASDEGAREIIKVSRNGKVNYSNISQHRDSDIIINTTPVGMYPNNGKRLIHLSDFPNCSGVVDVIYNPLRTHLILDAQDLGIACTGGLSMLVAQAIRASELFTGSKISEEHIDTVLCSLYQTICNIVLVGMPGSGKTEIGRSVAELLGKEFVDIDAMIVQRAGMTIPELFREYGEPHFRQLETDVIAEYSKLSGIVMATGGGAILSGENRRNLRQNSMIVHIERDLDQLQTDGRPLSKSPEALREMAKVRKPLYEACSSITIQNNRSIQSAANQIVEEFYAYSGD